MKPILLTLALLASTGTLAGEPTGVTPSIEGSETSQTGTSETIPDEGGETNLTEEEEAKKEIEQWLLKWFDPTTVATILSWVCYLGTIVTLVWKLKQLKQTNNLTLGNVIKEVTDELNKVLPEEVSREVNKYLPQLKESAERQTEVLKAFSKILCLAQENTPEARLAILDLIGQIGMVEGKEIEAAKETIKAQEQEKLEKKQTTEKAIGEIIEDTEKYDGTSI